MWEKEKLLLTSNFSFSHSVFKRPVFQRRQKVSLCGNGLSHFLFQTEAQLLHLASTHQAKKMLFESLDSFNIRKMGVLTFPKQVLVFTCMQYKCFEHTVEKGEIAHFSFSQCFLPIWRTIFHFHQI